MKSSGLNINKTYPVQKYCSLLRVFHLRFRGVRDLTAQGGFLWYLLLIAIPLSPCSDPALRTKEQTKNNSVSERQNFVDVWHRIVP